MPKHDCIHGVVGVLERDDTLLLIRRSRCVRAPGWWCFAGGAIEAGESPADAIIREYREELGLRVEPEEKLWSWLRPDGGLHLEWRRIRWAGGVLRPNPAEVSAVRWMTDDEIRRHPAMIPNNRVFLDHYRGSISAAAPAETRI